MNEIMSSTKSIANAVGGKTARACDSCVRKRARWYCAADDAFLCQSCDSDVHSANPLARRHQRIRLNSASSKPPNSPSWVSGFTRKPRTRTRRPPPPRPKSESDDLLSLLSNNPSLSQLVPEADEGNSGQEENNNEEDDDDLLYRVPTFEPSLLFVEENNESKSKSVGELSGKFHGSSSSFVPSELDLAEFAADVESLLGRNLESECFDMEALGLGKSVKVEDDEQQEQQEADEGFRVEQQFEMAEVDLMREPLFELNFDDYDHHEEKLTVVGVKNERQDQDQDHQLDGFMNKKRKFTLLLNCAAVISAWGNDKSPWTTGERPDFQPDDFWPHSMAICGVSYGHTCGEYGVSTAAMGDGGREARVSRYREKRRTRLFSKKIRYEVRKLNAEKRPRMKGRFVKRTPFAQPTLPIPIITIK